MQNENISDALDEITNLRLQLYHVTTQRDQMEILVNHYKAEAFKYKMLLAKHTDINLDKGFIK